MFESEGALWLRTTDYGDDKDRVVIKKTATPPTSPVTSRTSTSGARIRRLDHMLGATTTDTSSG